MGPIRIRDCPFDNITDLEFIGSAWPVLSIDHQIFIFLIVTCIPSQKHLMIRGIELDVPGRGPNIAGIIPVHNFHIRFSE
jgi:hypothetical protein